MTTLTEKDLRISFTGAKHGRKFDDEYGLSHCMKAVDFIVEFEDRYLFVEVKDPASPGAVKKGKRDKERFVRSLKSGKINNQLKYKYRDSFLYEWACGRANKPIHYYVLIALDSLTPGELMNRRDALLRQLPYRGPKSLPWTRPFVNECAVFTLDSWNRSFPKHRVVRLSDKPEKP